MGRKIPAKKHRGVKDPLKQQARRFQSLKGKINLAPSDPDEQPMPRSIERLFGLKPQYDKADKKKKLKHSAHKEDKHQPSVPSKKLNPVSRLKRAVGETGRAFSARISNAVRTLVSDADVLEYPMDTEKEDVKGDQVAEWKERRRAKKRKLDKQNGTREQDGEKKKKPHRLDLKKAARKAKAEEHIAQSREVMYERVQFGDVAGAPPALTAPRRAAPRDGAPRPGARNLLLTKLLNPANQLSAETTNSQSQASKGKKPQLSALEKERRERARQLAVEAYRQLKKSRERKQDS